MADSRERSRRADPETYGGYYTQDEVRGIVAFAATRHVQIVPEIDMPGHAQAAIAAYPALGTASGEGTPSLAVSSKWGVHTHLFNVEPSTFAFLENVLGEVLQLFPSPYVHVGGDEAVKDEWNASPTVQARARELGISDSAALQTYFTQGIGRYLSAHGRRLVGWDEILQPGLPSDAVVMSWHGTSGARAAARRGNDTVLAPQPTLYFDRRQSTLATEPPGRLEISSLADVYRFEPLDPQLSKRNRPMYWEFKRICGPNTFKPRRASSGWRCRGRRPLPRWPGRRRSVTGLDSLRASAA